jgi:3alpha(or 20beta)-hydroxysteroid dehydrogenase
MSRLQGKIAVVTGASRGIGAAIAKEFVEQGACVLLTDINSGEGARLSDALGKRACFRTHDVCDELNWPSVIESAEKEFGPVSVLVNNAGIIMPGNNEGALENIAVADYRRVIEVNQIGTFLGMKHVIPSMKRAGGGSIVNMSSVGGLKGLPNVMCYSATKWAVVGMTKCAALELGQFGIRVNSIHPGAIWTPIHYAGRTRNRQRGHAHCSINIRIPFRCHE